MFRPIFPLARPPVRAEELGPPPPMESPAEDSPPPKAEGESPVQFEMFNREWQQIAQQDNWDGFRIEAANQVTKYLQAAHTLFLGTQMRENGYIYQFGPAFQSEDQRTVLVARAGLDGAVNGRAIKKVGSGLELKCSSNSHLKDVQRNMHEGSLEYTGTDWCIGGKLIWQSVWILGGAFTQKIMPQLQLGGDLTLVPQNGVTIGQIGGRWTSEGARDIFTAQIVRTPSPSNPLENLHETKLAFVHKVTDRLSLGSEFKYSHPDKESGLSLAYEYTFRQARVQGNLDTDGKVSCCVQDFHGYGFSGMIDYFNSNYKFGVVMHILPQPEGGGQPPM